MGTEPHDMWLYTPSDAPLSLWHRCEAGEHCPPIFLLYNLGPRVYGKGACLRFFKEYMADPRKLPGGDGDAYVWGFLRARRPVLTSACSQFEGFVRANSP